MAGEGLRADWAATCANHQISTGSAPLILTVAVLVIDGGGVYFGQRASRSRFGNVSCRPALLLALLLAAGVNCANPPDQASADGCAGDARVRADVAMNAQWKLTLAAEHQRDKDYAEVPRGDTRPSYVEALLTAQRAWLKFRDSECEVEAYAVRGGSLEPQIAAQCEGRLTQERTKQLAAIAKGLD